MSADTPAIVLQRYLRAKAGESVVRLRDADEPEDATFTGTFISPEGHLLTSYHALQSRLFDVNFAEDFEISFEFDPAWLASGEPCGPFTVRARCERGWRDPVADLAMLELDYRPRAFLSLAQSFTPDKLLGRALRAYGHTLGHAGQASLGEIDGKYLRALPEQGRFRMTNVVRGEGQSGGPVLDLDSRCIVGVVVGFLQQEINTGDAAAASQSVVRRLGLRVDFRRLQEIWRRDAAIYLRNTHPQFMLLERQLPRLPEKYLRGRSEAQQVFAHLTRAGQNVVVLHGAPGSGKTSIALEAAAHLEEADVVKGVMWHDFALDENRSAQQLIRRVGVYLLEEFGVFEVVEEYPQNPGRHDDSRAMATIATCLRQHPCLLVLENVQFVLRLPHGQEVVEVLAMLTRATDVGAAKLVLTSWDVLPWDELAVVRLRGFSRGEIDDLVTLHGLDLNESMRRAVAQYRHDISAVQILIRQPDYGKLALIGRLPREPQELHRYWLTKYSAHLPGAARRVLLALAVLGEPADRDVLEEVAEVDDFFATLIQLQVSPPLLRTQEAADITKYYLHYNVQQAMLAIADRKSVVATHKLAAEYYTSSGGNALAAARHWWSARDPLRAIDLLHRYRESIIGSGGLEGIVLLADELEPEVAREPEGRYKLNVVLASSLNVRGRYKEAQEHWQFALDDSPSDVAAVMLHNHKADTLRLASDYVGARRAYQASLNVAGRSAVRGARGQIARANLGLAKLDRLRANYDDALARYADALQIFKAEFDQPGLIEAEFGLGEVYRLKRQLQESESWYARSLERSERIGSLERQAYAIWGLGEVHRLAHRYPDGIRLHQRGLELCRRVGDTRSEGWALLGIAEVRREDEEIDAALIAYDAADSKFRETRSTTEMTHVALGVAEAGRACGRVELDRYVACEAVYRVKQLDHCLIISLIAKGLACRTVSDEASAGEAFAEAKDLSQACSLSYEMKLAAELRATTRFPLLQLNYP